MKRQVLLFCACATLFLCLVSPVAAGPNVGGTLILHADPSLVYTAEQQSWCGMTSLAACSLAVTSLPWQNGTPIVFHALAAFPPNSEPRLKGMTFGVDYDPTKFFVLARGKCADFEIADGSWPDPETGTGLSWTRAQTNLLIEIYWFVGYAYSDQKTDSTAFAVIPHPVQSGVFVDDATPGAVDSIAAYGILGFGRQGSLTCPSPQLLDEDPWTPDDTPNIGDMPEESVDLGCTIYPNWLKWTGRYPVPVSDCKALIVEGPRGYAVGRNPICPTCSPVLAVFDPLYVSAVAFATLGANTDDTPTDVAYMPGAIVIVTVEDDLYSIDVSQNFQPVVRDHVDLNGEALGVAVSGRFAYVAQGSDGFRCWEVAPGGNLINRGSVPLTATRDVALSDGKAYVADGSYLRVVDVSNPFSLTQLGYVSVSGTAISVAAGCGLACVANGTNTLKVVDVSNPLNPGVVGELPLPGPPLDVRMSTGVVYAATANAVHVVDLSNPRNPVLAGTTHSSSTLFTTASSADRMYVNGLLPPTYQNPFSTPLLDIYSVAAPHYQSSIGSVSIPGSAQDVSVQGIHAYVTSSQNGLQVVNIEDPNTPMVIGSLDLPGSANGIAVSGDRAYVADGAGGLAIIDVTDPEAPSSLGTVDIPGNSADVALWGAYAYVVSVDFA